MINYPDEFDPKRASVFVRNELEMTVAPEAVWAWLVRADLWSTWYPNAADMSIEGGTGSELSNGTRFRWRTFGVTIDSTVREFVPFERIAWDGHALGVHVYHAWLIEKRDTGCRVLTEETQNGVLTRLGHLLTPQRMSKFHQIWLEQLHRQAREGAPPQNNLG